MRKRIIFLVAMFLSMVLHPCSEQIEVPSELAVKQTTEQCGFADVCSPLCTCQCCPSHLVDLNEVLVFDINVSDTHLAQGNSDGYEQLIISIWAPPKLA